MEPDEEAAAVVRLIFELAAKGTTAAQITKEMRSWSIPTPGEYKAAKGNHTHDISRTGGIWSSSTVLRILDDERYTGTYVIGKRSVLEVGGTKSRLKDRDKWYIIPGHHAALVSEELFEQAKQGIRRYSIPNKKQHDYLLKGRIICGCCDHSLSRVMQKTPYYHCRHSDADSSMCCHGMKIGIAELEQLIFEVLQKLIEASGASGQGAQNITPTSGSMPEYETQIAAIQDEKMKLYESFLSGEINGEEYKAQKEVLDVSLTKTKSAHAALTAQAKQAQEHRAEQVQRQAIIQEIAKADGLNASIADTLIEKVYVFPDKRIEIVYKIKDIFDTVV